MKTTEMKIGQHTVYIHDPADTPEAKAAQMQRIEKACIRFWKAIEREAKAN